AEKRDEARAEILHFLIDNALVDQYLVGLKISVDKKDIDARIQIIKDEIKKEGKSTFEKVLQELQLTETEMRNQIEADLRWEKHLGAQASEKALRELFDKNPDMFNGRMVRAKHILLMTKTGDEKAAAEAKTKLSGFKKQIETQVTKELTKLPA